MEIRGAGGDTDSKMEESDNSPASMGHPLSPCDSEISVGCELDPPGSNAPSPMELAEPEGDDEDGDEPLTTEDEDENQRRSPSTTRELSSSPGGEQESLTYISEDEYFRPLKRLAMSPPHSSISQQPSTPPSSTIVTSKVLLSQQQIHQHLQHHQQQAMPSSPSPEPSSQSHSPRHEDSPDEGGDVRELISPPIVARERGSSGNNNNNLLDKQCGGLRSFSILDILSYKPSKRKSTVPVKIERPWESRSSGNASSGKTSSQQEGSVGKKTNDKGSALDALFKMTNKTLDNLNKDDKAGEILY